MRRVLPIPIGKQKSTVFVSFCIPLAAIAAAESATYMLIRLIARSRRAVASLRTNVGEAAFIMSAICEDSKPLSDVLKYDVFFMK